jgi:acetyl-CoA carboxylase biotin carboxyl carrier protein
MKPSKDDETTLKENEETALKDKVSSLYELMKSEKLEELEVKDRDIHVYLKRKSKTPKYFAGTTQAPAQPIVVSAQAVESAAQATVAGDTVKSPITGTFYRAPSPTSPSFSKEGDVVAAGKTLCIVEAMKVMNEVKADSGMKILKILVENGKPVVSGQDLFQIEKL